MKEKYLKPITDTEKINTADVITTSVQTDDNFIDFGGQQS